MSLPDGSFPPVCRRLSSRVGLLATLLLVGAVIARADSELTLDELRANVQNAYTPEVLRGIAFELSQRPEADSVPLLEAILERCNAFEQGEFGRVNPGSVNVTRAYALYALCILARTQPGANHLIEENFRITRPIGLAMLKARYPKLLALIQRAVDSMSGMSRPSDAGGATADLPGVAFVQQWYDGGRAPQPDAEMIATMRDAAVVLEWSRSRNALPILIKMVAHPAAPYWRKRAYRAIADLNTQDSTRFGVLRDQLQRVRGDEPDACRWDLAHPESIRFSIDTISAEAFLVLALWRLDVPLRNKAAVTLPSLTSGSFTARAAAIDRLASTPQSAQLLARVVDYNDDATRQFLAVRLGFETNAASRAVLQKLTQDKTPSVAAAARKALEQR